MTTPSYAAGAVVPRRLARASLRDVAALAKVSPKTVSRVINGEATVRPETAARVRDAVAMLSYEPNDLARNLRQGMTTLALGLAITDVSNAFFSMVARGVEEVARSNGYVVISGNSDEDPGRESELVTTLTRRRIDALVIVPTTSSQAHLARVRATIPVIFVDRPPLDGAADAVLLDNANSAYGATARLVEQGHTRIGVVTGPLDLFTYSERLAGYRRALGEAGLPFDESLVAAGAHHQDEAELAALKLLRRTDAPSALFTMNNQMTIGAIKAIHALGLGAHLAITGFDDFELADVVSPAVTTLAHDPTELGRRAAQLALDRIEGGDGPPRSIVLPTQMIARDNQAGERKDGPVQP